jgi:hypothetical protein
MTLPAIVAWTEAGARRFLLYSRERHQKETPPFAVAKATEMLRSWECRLHEGPAACLMFWEYENFEYLT